jgi:imidazole glycerol-phosphate synthase subunit HisH
MIVVIDYGMGNIGSIANMLKKVGVAAVVSADIGTVESADKLILPGVGAFDQGMRHLRDLGLIPVLNRKVLEAKTPILGLCLGMQLFTRNSEEGSLPGLGWFDAETVRFRFHASQTGLKALHMGWNTVNLINPTALWKNMYPDARFYFVHAYHVVCHDQNDVTTTSHYGYEFASAITKGNVQGTQFHPEKSHKFGIRLFKSFVECC